MIKVCIKRENKLISQISASGHALFDQYGKDIVCAGVSSILIGGLNAIDQFGLIAKCDYQIEPGNVDVFIKDCLNHELQVILETLVVQLKTIHESYSNYIYIQEV